MQKKTIKKLSILGLVLMVASAVTAAIFPASKEDRQEDIFSISNQSYDDISTYSCNPTVDLLPGDTVCQDDSKTLEANSGSTSQWLSSDGVTTLGA
ncbi:hypothetical protein FAM09_12455 [Niastella caeni]|uniref:Uncharacterized protein n=1 Tax=Niastella caeni TaxID=2569763 RepID=A0A4S8HUK3_9BACT|nr:hypothetical protein [Niastella caeni]THU39318.1 hypothetical protein FAM09_12455 [Niastella caeni]